MREAIEEGFMVFASDGAEGIGAVREVRPDRDELLVYVENAGDFVIPLSAVDAVHSQKVLLRCDALEPRLRAVIGHAHDAEEPRYLSGAPYPSGTSGSDTDEPA